MAVLWEHRSEKSNRDITPKKLGYDALLPIFNATEDGVVRAPRKYDWSFRFCCRRFRDPKILTIGRESVGTKCPASIRMQKVVLQNKINVVYERVHNHPDSPQDRAQMPMGHNEISWIKARVVEGLDWKAIRARLRLDSKTLAKVNFQPLFCSKTK